MSWPVAYLGEVGSLQAGYGFPNKYQGKKAGDYPFAKVGDISAVARAGQKYIGSAGNYIDKEELNQIRGKPLPVGSIVFAKIGEAIRQNFRAVTTTEMIVDNNSMGLVPRESIVDTDYLYHFMCRLDLYAYTGATTVPALRKSTLEAIEIPLPPLSEQKRIAAILDKADAIRRKRHQAIELADQFLRSVFLNLFGDPVTNPKGWHSKPFGELVRDAKIGLVRSASEFGESFEYPYVRMDAITSRGGFLRELVQSTSATAAEVSEYSLRNGDFLFNTRNSKELVGKCTVFNSDERDVLFNNNIMRVRFVDGVSPHFVSYFLNSKGGQRELDKLKSGTTSVFAVYAKDLNRLPIPLPNSNVQQQFEAMVRHVDGQIAKAFCSAARNAGDLADALSKRAFAGEL